VYTIRDLTQLWGASVVVTSLGKSLIYFDELHSVC